MSPLFTDKLWNRSVEESLARDWEKLRKEMPQSTVAQVMKVEAMELVADFMASSLEAPAGDPQGHEPVGRIESGNTRYEMRIAAHGSKTTPTTFVIQLIERDIRTGFHFYYAANRIDDAGSTAELDALVREALVKLWLIHQGNRAKADRSAGWLMSIAAGIERDARLTELYEELVWSNNVRLREKQKWMAKMLKTNTEHLVFLFVAAIFTFSFSQLSAWGMLFAVALWTTTRFWVWMVLNADDGAYSEFYKELDR